MSSTTTAKAGPPPVGMPTAPPLPDDLEALLRRLRMPHTRAAAPEVIATAKSQRWEPVEVLRALFSAEVAGRDRSALATRRARAAFPTGKTFHAWQPEASSIPQPTQQALRTLEWLHRKENLVLCGPSGTGKTFFLEALGQLAVEQGLHVTWFTLEDLGGLSASTAPTTPSAKPSPGSCEPNSSSSMTSGYFRSPPTLPKGSTDLSTPPTKNGQWRSARICTRPGSTS